MSNIDSAPSSTPTPDDLKKAFKAFKKRLKLTRLDAESSLSGGPMGGSKHDIVAIVPPNQFQQAVWDLLVKQGKLKPAGHGMYELVEVQ